MSLNGALVYFASQYPIDKIFAYSSITDSFPSTIPTNISYAIAASAGGGTFLTKTITNPYGKAGIVTLSFSIDGSAYYEQTDQPNFNTQVSCFGSCSSSTVSFHMQNQSASPQTIYIQFAAVSLT